MAQVWPDARVRRARKLDIDISFRVFDPAADTCACSSMTWNSLSDTNPTDTLSMQLVLWEAARPDNAQLSGQAKAASIKLAEVVLDEASTG